MNIENLLDEVSSSSVFIFWSKTSSFLEALSSIAWYSSFVFDFCLEYLTTSLIPEAASAGIIPIIGQIYPWTSANNTQQTRREELNAWIVDYCTTNNILTFNASARIGIDRVGYPAGNLRDLAAGMSDDGVHLTELGKDGVVDELEDLLNIEREEFIDTINFKTDFYITSSKEVSELFYLIHKNKYNL